MKIADFFVQITAKGDLKELKMIADAQKAIKEQSKVAVAAAKVKVEQLKKETAEIQKQAKQKKEEPKTLKEYLIAQGKIWNQQNKINGLVAKGVLQTMGLSGAFIGVSAAIIGAGIALDKMFTKLAQANQLYTNFQRQTGLPMRSSMNVSGAMANLDVSMTPEQVMQNMQNLQSNLIGVQFGMGNIAPYQMAGINPFGLNPENMLDVIRKQMKGFAPAYRTFLLQQMGLDPRLGALIDLSDTDYLKYKKESLELYLSPEDRKAIQELAPEWNKVNLKFAKAWDKTLLLLMRDFSGLATEIAHVVEIISKAIEVINTILKPILDILTLVLKPIYYLLDDIIVWLLGGKSIIGDMLKGKFLDKKEISNIVKDVFGYSIDNLKEDTKKITTSESPILKGLTNAIPILGLTKLLMPKNIENNATGNKNISMKNDFNINVGNADDGYKLINPLRYALNGSIAQFT